MPDETVVGLKAAVTEAQRELAMLRARLDGEPDALRVAEGLLKPRLKDAQSALAAAGKSVQSSGSAATPQLRPKAGGTTRPVSPKAAIKADPLGPKLLKCERDLAEVRRRINAARRAPSGDIVSLQRERGRLTTEVTRLRKLVRPATRSAVRAVMGVKSGGAHPNKATRLGLKVSTVRLTSSGAARRSPR